MTRPPRQELAHVCIVRALAIKADAFLKSKVLKGIFMLPLALGSFSDLYTWSPQILHRLSLLLLTLPSCEQKRLRLFFNGVSEQLRASEQRCIFSKC